MKTSELIGAALDWAAGMCQGDKLFRPRLGRPDDWDGAAYRAGNTTDERWVLRAQVANVGWFADYTYNPSVNWLQGGPIIEREKIAPSYSVEGDWIAYRFDPEDELEASFVQRGPTPLIAAMRCYVASVLGDEVEIPSEVTA